jgi:hypothetical protein
MATDVAPDGLSDPLRGALAKGAASGLSGMLLVTGDPGGVVHLTGGRAVAIQTPGAPSAEVILLRSHRVPEAVWDAAFAAAARNGTSMGTELVAATAIGAGELEALLCIALADAMFVLASGHVERCRPQPGPVDCLLPLEPGAETDVLLNEAARRMRVLAARPGVVGRERVVPVPGAMRPRLPLGSEDEILAMANGRRTARDMAFALGRGVYVTMLQLARMREAGLLAAVPLAPPAAAAGQAPSRPSASLDQPDPPADLPQRRRGLPALPRRTSDVRAAESKPHRMLLPRLGRNADAGDAE